MDLIRKQFLRTELFRLFIVLQTLGIAAVTYMDMTVSYWDLFPAMQYGVWAWDFTRTFYWQMDGEQTPYNLYAAIFLFGPFLITKAADWVLRRN